MAELTNRERLDWLRLIRTENIGPITFFRLIDRFGSASAALDALPAFSRKTNRSKPLKAAAASVAEAELEAAVRAGLRPIAACEPDYPRLLRMLVDRPPLIYLRGHAALFERPTVALIGARNASGVGRKIARDFAMGLGQEGYCIVSGLARGIDAAAHVAALETGTIAVVAGGADVIYPPEHEDLTAEIAKRGAVLSEQPPGWRPTSRDFPRRNRLISGVSRGVVVIEAASRSGTLITANYALEQGREVFAVPGSPLDPRCQGANRLIKDGAVLTQTPQDIIEGLSQTGFGAAEPSRDLSDGWATPQDHDPEDFADLAPSVLELLSFTPLHRDEIIRAIDAPAGRILDALVYLVVSGDAVEAPGGCFVRS